MRIYIGSDHAGYQLKNVLKAFLISKGHEVVDCGAYDYVEDDDYTDYVSAAARQVSESPGDSFGIVVGGSGQGEGIMANRFPNVRAVVFNGQYKPENGREVPDELTLTREHNNANMLSLGAWFLSEQEAKDAVVKWLATPFGNDERHVRRIGKIEKLATSSRQPDSANLDQ